MSSANVSKDYRTHGKMLAVRGWQLQAALAHMYLHGRAEFFASVNVADGWRQALSRLRTLVGPFRYANSTDKAIGRYVVRLLDAAVGLYRTLPEPGEASMLTSTDPAASESRGDLYHPRVPDYIFVVCTLLAEATYASGFLRSTDRIELAGARASGAKLADDLRQQVARLKRHLFELTQLQLPGRRPAASLAHDSSISPDLLAGLRICAVGRIIEELIDCLLLCSPEQCGAVLLREIVELMQAAVVLMPNAKLYRAIGDRLQRLRRLAPPPSYDIDWKVLDHPAVDAVGCRRALRLANVAKSKAMVLAFEAAAGVRDRRSTDEDKHLLFLLAIRACDRQKPAWDVSQVADQLNNHIAALKDEFFVHDDAPDDIRCLDALLKAKKVFDSHGKDDGRSNIRLLARKFDVAYRRCQSDPVLGGRRVPTTFLAAVIISADSFLRGVVEDLEIAARTGPLLSLHGPDKPSFRLLKDCLRVVPPELVDIERTFS